MMSRSEWTMEGGGFSCGGRHSLVVVVVVVVVLVLLCVSIICVFVSEKEGGRESVCVCVVLVVWCGAVLCGGVILSHLANNS